MEVGANEGEGESLFRATGRPRSSESRQSFRLPLCSVLTKMEPMPQVTFSYTGQLAQAAGTPEETLDLADGASVRSALEELALRYDSSWRELVFDQNGGLRSTLLVVLDGVQVTGDKGAIILDDAKSVMLMTPIAGG